MISATSSLVPGWAGCALKTTGQPAARAEAVSPPAVEKASGEVAGSEDGNGAERAQHGAGCQGAGRGLRSGRAGSMRALTQEPSSRTEAKRRSWLEVRAVSPVSAGVEVRFRDGRAREGLCVGVERVAMRRRNFALLWTRVGCKPETLRRRIRRPGSARPWWRSDRRAVAWRRFAGLPPGKVEAVCEPRCCAEVGKTFEFHDRVIMPHWAVRMLER